MTGRRTLLICHLFISPTDSRALHNKKPYTIPTSLDHAIIPLPSTNNGEASGSVRYRGTHRLFAQLQMPSQCAVEVTVCYQPGSLQNSNLLTTQVPGQPTHWTHPSFILHHFPNHPQTPNPSATHFPSLACRSFPCQNGAV